MGKQGVGQRHGSSSQPCFSLHIRIGRTLPQLALRHDCHVERLQCADQLRIGFPGFEMLNEKLDLLKLIPFAVGCMLWSLMIT